MSTKGRSTRPSRRRSRADGSAPSGAPARTTAVPGTTTSQPKAANSSAPRSRSGIGRRVPSIACFVTPTWEADMAWYHEIANSLAALFGRRRQDREMDEEMRFHLEMETKRLVEAGLTDRDARQRARRDFGGVERHKDDTRD